MTNADNVMHTESWEDEVALSDTRTHFIRAGALRRGKQLAMIIRSFREYGEVSVEEMVEFEGISRTATYIYHLRKAGWDIETAPRAPREMATYRLRRPPTVWGLPRLSPLRWTCMSCGATLHPGSISRRTPTMGVADCPDCHAPRTFRRTRP